MWKNKKCSKPPTSQLWLLKPLIKRKAWLKQNMAMNQKPTK
jgi:hypothetical protein